MAAKKWEHLSAPIQIVIRLKLYREKMREDKRRRRDRGQSSFDI
jgi:hypothetical protein